MFLQLEPFLPINLKHSKIIYEDSSGGSWTVANLITVYDFNSKLSWTYDKVYKLQTAKSSGKPFISPKYLQKSIGFSKYYCYYQTRKSLNQTFGGSRDWNMISWAWERDWKVAAAGDVDVDVDDGAVFKESLVWRIFLRFLCINVY